MSLPRCGKIHPVIILLFVVGALAGAYVQYSSYQGKIAAEVAKEEAKNRPQNRGLGAASEMMVKNPRLERTRPFKFVFSDTPPTSSKLGASKVDSKYPAGPSSAETFGTRHLEIMLDGVKHFRETNSFNKKAIVSDTADLMEEIVESMHVGLGSKLVQFRERLSPILIDPQVSGDPYFQYLAGLVHVETGESQKAEELFYGSIFDHTKYDYPSRYVLPSYNRALENGLERNIHSKLHERAADAIVCWLKYDFAETPEDHRYVWGTLSKTIELLAFDDKLGHVKKVLDLNEKEPFAPAWVGAMMKGKYHTLMAENERATKEEKAASLKLAMESLAEAAELGPGFPDSYVEMIQVAKAADGQYKTPEYWADQAKKNGLNNYGVHRKLLESLDTPEEKMAYGVGCFELGKFDTMVPFALVGAYQRAQDSVEDKEQIKKVIDCLGELAADPKPKFIGSKKVSKEWLLSAQAVVAARAGENEQAAKAFAAVGDKFDNNALKVFPGIQSLSKTRVRVAALASGASDRIDRIESLLEKQRAGEDQTVAIENEVNSALKEVKGDKVYFQSVGDFSHAFGRYEKGEATKLGFGNGMLLWDSETESQVEADGKDSVIISTLGGKNHATLKSAYYTPGPKTIELDVEFLSKNDPCAAEIVFGGWRDYGPTGVVTFDAPGKRVGFGSTSFDGNIAKFQCNTIQDSNSIRVNVAKGYCELFVNNQFVMRSTCSRIETTSEIGLGLNGYGDLRGKVKFSNVRVKKWDSAPSLEGGDLVAHYKKATSADPQYAYGWFFLGLAELQEGDFAAAKVSVEKAVMLGVPEFQAAPYLGDIADRSGDADEARQQYQIVFDGMKTRPAEILQTEQKDQTYDQFQTTAARFLWNELNREDLNVASRLNFVKTFDKMGEENSPLGSSETWIRNRLIAQVRSTMSLAETEKAQAAEVVLENADKIVAALRVREDFPETDDEDDAASEESAKSDDKEEPREMSPSLRNAVRAARQAKAKFKGYEGKAKKEKQLALRAVGKAIELAGEDFTEELTALKTSIENGELFSQKTGQGDEAIPAYLDNDGLLMFPTLRDSLREDWQAFYK